MRALIVSIVAAPLMLGGFGCASSSAPKIDAETCAILTKALTRLARQIAQDIEPESTEYHVIAAKYQIYADLVADVGCDMIPAQ